MKTPANRLRPPVDAGRDHILGPADARVTLVEYGDYQCPYCRRAHAGIQRLNEERLEGQMRYVFRHLPNTRLHPQARLAAEAAEAAAAQGRFRDMHERLFAHEDALDRDSLVQAAAELGLDAERFARELDEHAHAERVEEDLSSGRRSGARATPAFFINGRRYDGPWDEESLLEAIEQPLGLRLRLLAREFAGLSASAGLMMIAAAVLALVWANSPWSESYAALWQIRLDIAIGGRTLALSLHDWINDGLIVVFFFVVGLEIKRELAGGELAEPRRAALPLAAAVGGMLGPALLYLLFNAGGPWAHGWGVPSATDTAFALGLLALLGRRVPLSLRVFVATLAIADDVGAILVLAFFYTENISWLSLALAAVLFGLAMAFNRARVYRALPYALLGIALWLAVLFSGVHATLAGVLLAMAIPTRSPPNPAGLLDQSVAAFRSIEAPQHGEHEAHYQSAVRTLETVVERMLSPAQRLERDLQPWSSYLILPLFALANAGVPLSAETFDPLHPVTLGVVLGLVVGKPLGITLGSWLAVRAGLADEPRDITWGQLVGAACLCGIGFTMSIFIAGAAFTDAAILTLVKVSVMLASVLAGVIGWLVLRSVYPASERRTQVVGREAAGS